MQNRNDQIILENQTGLVYLMKAMGYRNVSIEGVCFGISMMIMLAIHSGKLSKCMERLQKIHVLTQSDLGGAKEIEELWDDLKQLDQNTLNDFQKFFDGVHLIQSAYNVFPYLDADTPRRQEDIHHILKLIKPFELDGRELHEFKEKVCGIYTHQELKNYFATLHHVFQSSGLKEPLTIVLHSTYHVMKVSYDPSSPEQPWIYVNPAKLPPYPVAASNFEMLSNLISTDFPASLRKKSNGYTAFSSRFFCENQVVLDHIEQQLEIDPMWNQIHHIDAERILRMDAVGINLQYLTAYHGHLKLLKQIMDINPALINGAGDHIPLFIAAQNNHVSIVKYLLEEKADPDRHANCNFSKIEMCGELDAPLKNKQPGVLYLYSSVYYYAQGNEVKKISRKLKGETQSGSFDVNENMKMELNQIPIQFDQRYAITDADQVEKINQILKKWVGGVTPLHIAVENRQIESIQLLLSFGARTDIETVGYTGIRLAQHKKQMTEGFNAVYLLGDNDESFNSVPNQKPNVLYLKKRNDGFVISTLEQDDFTYLPHSVTSNLMHTLHKEKIKFASEINDRRLVKCIATLCGYPDVNQNLYLQKEYEMILDCFSSSPENKKSVHTFFSHTNNDMILSASSNSSVITAHHEDEEFTFVNLDDSFFKLNALLRFINQEIHGISIRKKAVTENSIFQHEHQKIELLQDVKQYIQSLFKKEEFPSHPQKIESILCLTHSICAMKRTQKTDKNAKSRDHFEAEFVQYKNAIPQFTPYEIIEMKKKFALNWIDNLFQKYPVANGILYNRDKQEKCVMQ